LTNAAAVAAAVEEEEEEEGWLSAEGLGWVVGLLRLNGQAMRVDSPIPAMILNLAHCPDEEELDTILEVLQPVMVARKTAMERFCATRARELELEQEHQEEEEEEEEEELPELEDMFPPKRAIGLFLLESAANHSCDPSAEILPLDYFTATAAQQVEAIDSAAGGDEASLAVLADSDLEGSSNAGANTTAADYEQRGAGIAMVARRDIAVGEEITIW
jgi:hypothetical protein